VPHPVLINVFRPFRDDQPLTTLSTLYDWSVGGADVHRQSFPICSSETVESNQSELMDGAGVPAVEEKNVEADRKGQRGHKAQHPLRVDPGDLKCAYLDR